MKKARQILCGVLAGLFLYLPLPAAVSAQPAKHNYSGKDIVNIANGIVNWKKKDNGSAANGFLINNTFLELAGTTPGDWYPIGLARLQFKDDFAGYLAIIKENVETRYKTPEKLSAAKATEWHRISLAVLAAGGDPTKFGKDANGNPINLIADGTYNRGKTAPLGKQGINGWIWGLITLDAMRYPIPAGSFYSRDDIIVQILRQQLTDGGFALSGKQSDPDITAMAIQALTPYYNTKKNYHYLQKANQRQADKSVRQVVDEAISWLARTQLKNGDFSSWGTENAESTAQVAVALCCLGIDIQKDERFIKNGHSLIDGILRYRQKDGGFVHTFVYQADNPTSLPDKSNTMASEQVLYTMAAIWRQMNGMRTLYDFRAEQSPAMHKRIDRLKQEIASVTVTTNKSTIEKLCTDYYSIPESERNYVSNFVHLSDAAKKLKVDTTHIAAETPTVRDEENIKTTTPAGESVQTTAPQGEGETTIQTAGFSQADQAAVNALPKQLTTEQYVEVLKLLDKLEQSENFKEKEAYHRKLSEAKEKIEVIQAEIDAINREVKEKLYPLNKMDIRDKATVDDIVRRYKKLSPYDRQKIERIEDILKTKTKIDNLLRAVVIAAVLALTAAVTLVFVIKSLHKRRHKKQTEMAELAALYEDDA